jgi:DtxR family Mn-dependent transcriptional regulator
MISRAAEDYLEAIIEIAKEKGHVRVKDIAVTLSVTPPSVIEMAKKLDEGGYVNYRKYDGITLTEEGEKIARVVRERHEIIRSLLEILDVPSRVADEDACVMEHELHPKTIEQLKNLVNFVRTAPDYPEWLRHFEVFCQTGEHPCKGERGRKG